MLEICSRFRDKIRSELELSAHCIEEVIVLQRFLILDFPDRSQALIRTLNLKDGHRAVKRDHRGIIQGEEEIVKEKKVPQFVAS